MVVLKLCRDSLGNFINSTSGFELFNNLTDHIFGKGIDCSKTVNSMSLSL